MSGDTHDSEAEVSLLNDDSIDSTDSTAQDTLKIEEIKENEDPRLSPEVSLEEKAGMINQILVPVCITMCIVIAIVKSISFPWQDTISAAMVYNESANDDSSTRFLGSLVNALIFVAMIVVVTVVFVILYKYRCLRIIYGWLLLSTGMMLAGFGGYLSYEIIKAINIPMDYITFGILLWNFAVVGNISIFWHAPIKVNQAYLIIISVILAVVFTRLPEWTTWTILAAIAIYDLFAVLCPKGPLRVLVETAQERDEPIPALIYNASVFIMMVNGDSDDEDDGDKKTVKLNTTEYKDDDDDDDDDLNEGDKKDTGLYTDNDDDDQSGKKKKKTTTTTTSTSVEEDTDAEKGTKKTEDDDDEEDRPKSKGVKLGLGDFVFYSVLVGRAALFDMLTVFTCFIGIVTGLFATILLLAVWKKALPALPISIALGIIFFFVTKLALLPYTTILFMAGIVV
eukprot:TRINITY_DN597_c5_g1_i1.p1 TRINITY_DN597_c5_g1~~TRINITY_DN597_c5_g1_i1.p1  ORF type:complete len:453 (+),score=130.76 TRINITY_DN597_c5_g1_i1:57-1415(+)